MNSTSRRPAAEASTRPLRIAIVGGDDRTKRINWSQPDLDVRCFNWFEIDAMIRSYKAGKLDRVVVLTRWLGHAAFAKIRAAIPGLIVWSRGMTGLARELPKLLSSGLNS